MARQLYIESQWTLDYPVWSAWSARKAARVWHETGRMPEEDQEAKAMEAAPVSK